jgi:hypothetical protein
MNKKYLALLLLVGASAVLAATRRWVAIKGPLPGRNTEIGRASFRGSEAWSPHSALYCKGIGYLDMGSAADGPAYYFERSTGKIIGRCGGYCMSREAGTGVQCRTKCPPKEWTCR